MQPIVILCKHDDAKGDVNKNIYYVILAGVDEGYEWYSPTISHFYLFLQEMYEGNQEKINAFDFTTGGEHYKVDIGGEKKVHGV